MFTHHSMKRRAGQNDKIKKNKNNTYKFRYVTLSLSPQFYNMILQHFKYNIDYA